jgi:hypothetical protein
MNPSETFGDEKKGAEIRSQLHCPLYIVYQFQFKTNTVLLIALCIPSPDSKERY